MDGPPDKKIAGTGKSPAGLESRKPTTSYQKPATDANEIAVSDAVHHLRHAGRRLRAAAYRLDDAGLFCVELNELAAGAAALNARWHGRCVPGEGEVVPGYLAASAAAWRRQHGRRY